MKLKKSKRTGNLVKTTIKIPTTSPKIINFLLKL
jgi:hypothetical protein